jgi:putative FmdB family regulatory protein
MPIYEYLCSNCGHDKEAFQRMSDAPLVKCPECGQDTLRKVVLSAPSFKLKGKGWYETDFKNSGKAEKKPEANHSTDKAEKKPKGGDAKTDAKQSTGKKGSD